MKKIVSLLSTLFLLQLSLVAQNKIKSPSEFLGYELGSRFTQHFQVLAYFDYIQKNSDKIKLSQYGETYEHRPLMIAFVSSKENILNLDSIRVNHLRLTQLEKGKISADQKSIVWLSYNVHGNEAVSTEASMMTLFELVNPKNEQTKKWLDNTLVMIDPCLNPDGRERYVQWYNQRNSSVMNPNPDAWEHNEPWPGGRVNHYLFDLNRDWAWQTQQETQSRNALYQQWMPQVHVDFHEMGINEPYYFAPASEPIHQDITNWQREFQTTIGLNHAKYFDKNGWLYFTKEVFDLMYPSYGDTWPIFNGAIGMTYEQGGSGRAGLAVKTEDGDTLTLKERIQHHFTTSLSTIEATSNNSEKVISEFQKYFKTSAENPSGIYKTYVIKSSNESAKLRQLTAFLSKQNIQFGLSGKSNSSKGFSYRSGKNESISITSDDIIISAYQPKSVLLKSIFEPKTFFPDSLTYDITAWSLPYFYDLDSYALTEKITSAKPYQISQKENGLISENSTYAILSEWKSVEDVKFLSALLKAKITVRYSEEPFTTEGKTFERGTLIITKKGNEHLGNNWTEKISSIAATLHQPIFPVSTGFVSKGKDFGSASIRFLKAPQIGIFTGNDVSSNSLGEIWHFFEQQIEYPVSIINASQFGRLTLSDYDVLIFPAGYFGDMLSEKNTAKLTDWISSGGRIILLNDAITNFSDKPIFGLESQPADSIQKAQKNKKLLERLSIYANRERDAVTNGIAGSILKIKLDNTHPLAFGYPDQYFTLKLDTLSFTYLKEGWNVGVLLKDSFVSGFAGSKALSKTKDALIFGVQPIGRGSAVYLIDDPLFRGFWYNGMLLFGNAVFHK